MGQLMKYLKDYKKESVLAPLFKLLEAFFELLVPLVMANIIDRGIENADMGYIGKNSRFTAHPFAITIPIRSSRETGNRGFSDVFQPFPLRGLCAVCCL